MWVVCKNYNNLNNMSHNNNNNSNNNNNDESTDVSMDNIITDFIIDDEDKNNHIELNDE